jgi:hypothetical protein
VERGNTNRPLQVSFIVMLPFCALSMLVAAVALWVQLRFKPALVVSTAVNHSLAVSTRSSARV